MRHRRPAAPAPATRCKLDREHVVDGEPLPGGEEPAAQVADQFGALPQRRRQNERSASRPAPRHGVSDADGRRRVFPACRCVKQMTREAAGASTMRTCQGSSSSFSSRRHHADGESVYSARRAISRAASLAIDDRLQSSEGFRVHICVARDEWQAREGWRRREGAGGRR